MWEKKLKMYDDLVLLTTRFKRKGKTVPHTGSNGYMFSVLNKEGELGIRLSKKSQESFTNKYDSGPFMSHGATMKDYVIIPDSLLKDPSTLITYLEESFDYVNSLPSKKKK